MILKTLNCDPDVLAGRLLYMGQVARAMPPSWKGARISIPICGPDGQYIGRALPGRGLFVDFDLNKVAGIKKPLANVYQRTMVMKLLERLGDDRMAISAAALLTAAALWPQSILGLGPLVIGAITTYDGIIAARAGGKANDVLIGKASFSTLTNQWSSMFRASGFPDTGVYSNIPGGVAPHAHNNAGAWSQGLSNPVNPDKKYLLTMGFTSSVQNNMAILLDLLVAAGNILATVSSSQTINSTALTRYTSGSGVMMTFDVTTNLGTGTANLTVTSYTNQAGTAARSTPAVALTASAISQRLVPIALGPFMELQSGDFGVRSVETLQQSAALSAGVYALNLYFPLAFIPGLSANTYVERESTIQIDGLTELVLTSGGDIGCLTAYIVPASSTAGQHNWFLRTCAG